MVEALTIIIIAAGAFIATSIDNLVLLTAFHTGYKDHSPTVTAGYITGMLLVGFFCVVIGEVGEFIPVAYLGLLGFIPLYVGTSALVQLLQRKHPAGGVDIFADASRDKVYGTVLITQLANGADTTVTFSALLADSSDKYDFLIEPTFLVMVLVFAWLAKYSQNHQKLTELLTRYGRYVTPVILVVVGAYILNNTVSDLMPGS